MDGKTNEPLAFVAIAEAATVNGTYSDIDGYFTMTAPQPDHDVRFNLIGYDVLVKKWNGEEPWNISMTEKPGMLNEVVIRPGLNPAERIIQKTIDNKKQNNPESDLAFTYDSYNKLLFSAQLDSAIVGDSARIAKLDSTSQEMYEFFEDQYLFMMESITQRKFFPPDHSEETIIANRVSGLKRTDFFLLGTQLQSFSFYGETVDLLGSSFLSPIADNAIKKYLFILEDTTFIDKDTVFTISFRPRKGKNFDGMQGSLFINTNGYALQNVLASPAEPEGFDIRIQQQYEWLEGRKWFPKQLNSLIIFSGLQVEGVPMLGEGKSYIKNVKLDAPLKRSEFTPVTLLMAPRAGDQPDSVWNAYRDRQLEKKELLTYHTIDSLGQAENFDRKLKVLEALVSGQIVLGKVSFDLNRLIRFNNYEGYRLGAGFHTNDFLTDKFSIGGYYAYGFKDRHSKYGGDLRVNIYKKRNAWVKALYENDVLETGGNQFDKPAEGLIGNIYPLFISRMDRREKYELQLNGRLIGNVSANVFINHQFLRPFDGYRFTGVSSENITLYTSDLYLTEAGITLRYAPGEKLVRTNTREIRLGGRFPVFYARFTKGIRDLLDGDIDYTRYDVMIEKTFRIITLGDFSIKAVGGYVPENVPLPLLYNARGTWDKFTVAAPGTFETMRTNEFQNSQFVALHFRHNFKDLLFKREKFKPYINLVHSMMWGSFEYPQSHNLAITSVSKGYYESGIQLDKLLVSNLSALGFGTFYRYGPYHLPRAIDNFAFKLTISINL